MSPPQEALLAVAAQHAPSSSPGTGDRLRVMQTDKLGPPGPSFPGYTSIPPSFFSLGPGESSFVRLAWCDSFQAIFCRLSPAAHLWRGPSSSVKRHELLHCTWWQLQARFMGAERTPTRTEQRDGLRVGEAAQASPSLILRP